MSWIRRTAFHCIRAVGGFSIAQRLTRERLRILCYHGFSVGDEHLLSPYVFMRPETFERRMLILQRRKIPVVSIDEGMRKLAAGEIRKGETVLTMDDGWATNLRVLPLLQKLGYPVCIYITTEHLSAGPEAFNLSLLQLLNDSNRTTVTFTGIHPAIDGHYNLSDLAATTAAIVKAAESGMSLSERQGSLRKIAASLGIDYAAFSAGGRYRFMTAEELRHASGPNVSIQMHTHTHRLPDDRFDEFARELTLNRNAILEATGTEPIHFCYPSGIHSAVHNEWLKQMQVASATTCEPGHNPPGSNLLMLRRYLDSESVSDIEFEAEVAGVREIFRSLRDRLRGTA